MLYSPFFALCNAWLAIVGRSALGCRSYPKVTGFVKIAKIVHRYKRRK
jgi:hypothetical protein